MDCKHIQFQATVCVNRLEMPYPGPPLQFAAEVSIKCVDCGVPFEFTGLAMGVDIIKPTVSAHGLTLRAPLKPHSPPPALRVVP